MQVVYYIELDEKYWKVTRGEDGESCEEITYDEYMAHAVGNHWVTDWT